MKTLTPLPPPPRRREIMYACGRRAPSRRVQRVSAKKVDRFMKSLWTMEKELKELSQEHDDKSQRTED